jgi:hypothetical protein
MARLKQGKCFCNAAFKFSAAFNKAADGIIETDFG